MWPYWVVGGSIGLHMYVAILGCMWLHSTVCGCIVLCVAVLCCMWLYWSVCGYIGLYVAVVGLCVPV